MNKAFRRSLLSLTAASAMAGSAFAGNAAYLDVKVNYLNPDNTVILGIDDDKEDGKQRDRVEILVSVLDKDGNYADKDKDGKTLTDIEVRRNATNLDVDANTSVQPAGGVALVNASGAIAKGKDHHKFYRTLEEDRNINRFVLDYTDFVASKLEDTLEIKGGALSRDVVVNLSSTDAKGLVLRVAKTGRLKNTSTNTFVEGISSNDEDNYLNENFKDINVTDDANLDTHSRTVPTAVAGDMIPFRIYASTVAVTGTALKPETNATSGKFTLAPNLEGKTIVVTAVADYDIEAVASGDVNGSATTILNSVEVVMKNGVAVGEIKIEQGLPGTNSVTGGGVKPHDTFTKKTDEQGLGVAFVAYVKDDVSIANVKGIKTSDSSTIKTVAASPDTDVVVVRSGDPVGLKAGTINAKAAKASKLWDNTDTTFYMMESNGTGITLKGTQDANVTLTVVDEFDNPALVAVPATLQYYRFDNDDEDNEGSRFKTANLKSSSDIKVDLDDNGTGAKNIATTIEANITVRDDKNGSGKETLHLSFADGSLSGMDPVDLTLVKVEPVKSKISGNPVLGDIVSITSYTNSDDNSTDFYHPITSGLEPLDGIGTERDSKNIYPEFKAKFKVTAVDLNSTDGKTAITLKMTIPDPEKAGDFVTSDYFVDYVDRNGSFGYKLDGAKEGKQTATAAITKDLKISGDSFEFNVTAEADTNITIKKGTKKTALAKVSFGSFTTDDIKKLKGNSINVTFKAYDKTRQAVYAEAYFETSEEPIGGDDKDALVAGSVLKFKFSGDASEGDKIVLDFNGTNNNVLLEGEEYDSNSESNKIETTLGADKIVSVVLYDVNGTKNNPGMTTATEGISLYSLGDIKVNGLPVIYKTQQDDGDTDDIYEVGLADLFDKKITIKSGDGSNAGKIEFDLSGSLTYSDSDDSGDADDAKAEFSSDVQTELNDAGKTSKAVTLKKEVKTGLYYGFFGLNKMANVRDKFDNWVNTEEDVLEDNFIIECSSGLECDVKSESGTTKATDSYIRFKPEAAGTTQTITFKVKDKPEITNTISFANIVKSVQNTKFDIMTDVQGRGGFNPVNSEVIVKIIGDGGNSQEEVSLVATSDNKDAKVKLVPLAVNSKFFRSILNSNGNAETTIDAAGNYYFVTSSKPGKVTITASGTISKDDSDTKEEVKLSGKASVEFVAVDLDNPDVSKGSVTAIPSGVSVKINDANLDVERTTVQIKGVDNDSKKTAEYKGNNTFVATGLAKGVYQIIIKATDLAGNYAEADYVRVITEGADAASLEAEVANALASKSYAIDGTFQAYDFKDGKAHLNWMYKDNADGKYYRLLGDKNANKDANPFGWKEVSVKPDASAEKWFMVKLTGKPTDADAAGKFGWAMVRSDMGVVKKIAGVKADGSFEYLDITITASMKDGKITFSKK